ncbi:MAG TPA: exodeoxyribonuclease VII large subunit [Thermomicrobiales bacterium]|jgi:exodeoxyribonuclease VII large subunit|nr:exodeoxyribonuclease VII large subunit [Thermomicrobiales bacterium]
MSPPGGRPWPVGDLTSYIQQRLEADPVLGQLWVQGEVSNVFRARSGHCYFTLRDETGQLKSALFRTSAVRSRYVPVDGDDVIVYGRISLYPRDGAIQLYAELVERAGVGLDQMRLELLRQQLEAEGLFDPGRKRTLPGFPRRIGVVTSPDGSVWHDIQRVVERRYPLAELVLAPSAVQGDGAPASIVAALTAIASHPEIDVIIIGRGGGSAEDLAAFNAEAVARAVFACPVPTISAVGHETDWSICDLVADVRAPTPSAAAELATPSGVQVIDAIDGGRRRLREAAQASINRGTTRVEAARQRLALRSPGLAIAQHRFGVLSRQERMGRAVDVGLRLRLAEVAGRRTVLAALSPSDVLRRGYSVVAHERGGQLVSAPSDVRAGDRIGVRTAGGSYSAIVESQNGSTSAGIPSGRPRRRGASSAAGSARATSLSLPGLSTDDMTSPIHQDVRDA